MNAKLYFSDGTIETVSGVDSIGHAENVAHVIASRKSAEWGIAIWPTNAEINLRNFSAMMGPNVIMQGVKIL